MPGGTFKRVRRFPPCRLPLRRNYAARFALPFVTLVALAAAARTLASARSTTCRVAFWNWSNAAVEAANVDFRALTATSEPAGADWLAFSTQAATPFV